MDAARFDALVRSLDLSAPRRAALALFGGGLSAVLTRVGIEDVAGKNKKKKRKKKKKCKGNTKKCGKKCIPKEDCCNAADCGSDMLSCVAGVCTCPDPSDVACDFDVCCDPAEDEVCNFFDGICQIGCSETDFCTDDDLFICSNACVCVTSVNDTTTCTEGEIIECITCENDLDCEDAFGEPAVCISNGEFCDFCPGLTAFCVTNICPNDAPLRARGATGRRLTDRKKLAR